MRATHWAPSRPVGYGRTLNRVVTCVIVLSFAGAAVGASQLMRSDAFRDGSFGAPRTVDTSFGSMTVNGVDILDGLSAKDLGGMTHGISGLVLSDKAQAQVLVTLTNTSKQPLAYDPDLFRLREGADGQPIAPIGSSPGSGTIPTGTSIDLLLDFVVSRTGADLFFDFADPGAAAPVVVPVGTTDIASPPDTGGSHAH
jgi:hypothetical protein